MRLAVVARVLDKPFACPHAAAPAGVATEYGSRLSRSGSVEVDPPAQLSPVLCGSAEDEDTPGNDLLPEDTPIAKKIPSLLSPSVS